MSKQKQKPIELTPRQLTIWRNRILRAIYRNAGLPEPKRIRWETRDFSPVGDPMKLGEAYHGKA